MANPMLLYGSELFTLCKNEGRKIKAVEMRF